MPLAGAASSCYIRYVDISNVTGKAKCCQLWSGRARSLPGRVCLGGAERRPSGSSGAALYIHSMKACARWQQIQSFERPMALCEANWRDRLLCSKGSHSPRRL
jgi:hypothetical protein